MVCWVCCTKVLPKFTGQEHKYEVFKTLPVADVKEDNLPSKRLKKEVQIYEEKRHKELCMKNLEAQKLHLLCDF